LASIRQKLADNRQTTSLFDTQRFARHMEPAYTVMYDRHHLACRRSRLRVSTGKIFLTKTRMSGSTVPVTQSSERRRGGDLAPVPICSAGQNGLVNHVRLVALLNDL
jgi:hypothetical protein